jgi:surface protein
MPLAMPAIIGASQQKRSGRPFIIKVNYASGFTVTLPLVNGYNYNFIVDWGDGAVGQVTAYNDANRIHTYASGGTYTITMTGTLEGWSVYNGALKNYLIEVTQWGRTGLKYLAFGFYGCTRLVSCKGPLDTSGITGTKMWQCFRNCTALTSLEADKYWVTSSCTNVGGMFYNCSSLQTLDTSGWDTSNVTSFYGGAGGWEGACFALSGITTLDMTSWDTSKVTSFALCFLGCPNLTGFTNEDNLVKSACTNMTSMFQNCGKLTSLNVSNWDTSNVTGASSMFQNCASLTSLDLTYWNTAKITSFENTFYRCTSITSIDITGWNTDKVQSFKNTFADCYKLTTITGEGNLVKSACTTLSGTFHECLVLSSIDMSEWDLSNVTIMGGGAWESGTFSLCRAITSLDFTGQDTSKVIDFGNCFLYCTKLKSIKGMDNLVQSACTSTFGMIKECPALTSVDMSEWDTSNVTTMGGMFAGDTSLTSLDFTGLNTAKVTSFNSTFNGCTGLTSITSTKNLVSSACTDMALMFYKNYKLTTIDSSGWNCSNVTSLNRAFMYCSSLTALNVAGWGMNKLTSLDNAFNSCSSLATFDPSSWSISSALTNIGFAWANCTLLSSMNMSGWDMSEVTLANNAFATCTSLTSITFPNSLTFIATSMCAGCSALATINIGTGVASIATGAFNLGGTAGRSVTYNFYPSTAPTISGTPFPNFNTADNVHLHVPTASSSYNTAPWTTDAIFDQPISFDL